MRSSPFLRSGAPLRRASGSCVAATLPGSIMEPWLRAAVRASTRPANTRHRLQGRDA